MDLHPYDGRWRRFRHDDPGDQVFARGLVERLLGMPLAACVLRYDLAFFSGGMGVVDQLFISVDAADTWCAALPDGFLPAEEALALDAPDGDLRWLFMSDDDLTPDAALTMFVSQHRAPFQAAQRAQTWVEAGSGVNSWTVAYTYQGWLHWLSHEEG